MTFGKIEDEEGNEVELTEGSYSSFIKSKDSKVRKAAFEKLFGEYDKLKYLANFINSFNKNF